MDFTCWPADDGPSSSPPHSSPCNTPEKTHLKYLNASKSTFKTKYLYDQVEKCSVSLDVKEKWPPTDINSTVCTVKTLIRVGWLDKIHIYVIYTYVSVCVCVCEWVSS